MNKNEVLEFIQNNHFVLVGKPNSDYIYSGQKAVASVNNHYLHNIDILFTVCPAITYQELLNKQLKNLKFIFCTSRVGYKRRQLLQELGFNSEVCKYYKFKPLSGLTAARTLLEANCKSLEIIGMDNYYPRTIINQHDLISCAKQWLHLRNNYNLTIDENMLKCVIYQSQQG